MSGAFGGKVVSPSAFCLLAIGIALVLFVLPYPARSQLKRIWLVERSHAAIAMAGPSTIDYVSKCDSDLRTLPAMLTDLTGSAVLDLSVGGQPLIETINLSAVSGNKDSITDVVLPLVFPQIDDWTTPPYRELLFYKALVPAFPVFKAASTSDLWNGLTDQPRRLEREYRFAGRSYPDYRVLAAREFARETRLAGCPETLTHDADFTRSYFWWTHVAATRNAGLYDLVAELKAELARKGKRLHVVVLPTNLEVMGQFDASWPATVQREQTHLVAELAQRGVEALDLSAGFGSDEFSTPWCACIHLNQKGRLHLAQAIAAALGEDQSALLRGAPALDASGTAP